MHTSRVLRNRARYNEEKEEEEEEKEDRRRGGEVKGEQDRTGQTAVGG